MDYDNITEPIFHRIPKGWLELASRDDSESYEVDESVIYLDNAGRFVLATASGCSCWDGDWDIETFDTLDALAVSVGVLASDERRFPVSIKGGEALVAEARAALPVVLARLNEAIVGG